MINTKKIHKLSFLPLMSLMIKKIICGVFLLITTSSNATDLISKYQQTATAKVQLDINHIINSLNQQHNNASPLIRSARQPISLSINSELLGNEKFQEQEQTYTEKSNDLLQHLTSVASTSVSNFKQTGDAIALDNHRQTISSSIDNKELTASHKTLPIGTKIKVTNKNNGRSVIVKISNRLSITSHRNKIISLSQTAASQIGILNKGIGKVLIEKIR